MDRIKNIVVLGIGANDEYLKALPEHLNKDITRQRNLYSVFEPSQLDSLPADVTAENTLFIAISRGGNTEETIKSLYFAKKQGLMKYLVGYANKGLVKEFVEQENGILQSLNPNIGGRYMWAKGLIVLVPFFLAASKAAWHEYTDAMIDFDDKFWPVGNDRTVLAMSKHLFYYREIYNIFTIIACSNNPTLEKGLREFFQNFNEASGKIKNASIAVGPGMDMLPFAHSGADGMLGAAISALLYGVFVFDTSYTFDPARDLALAKEDLLPKQEAHAGLSKALLKMACVFPNQAKFTYAGGPNMMVGMNGINYRNLATLTALYQNLMYVFLISNETNPDSNPNVQMVRDTTGGVVKALLQRHPKESPIEVINRAIPNIMKG